MSILGFCIPKGIKKLAIGFYHSLYYHKSSDKMLCCYESTTVWWS